MVTEYDFVVLKAQLKSVWQEEIRLQTRHYFIERKDVLGDIELLKKEEMKFWTDVLKKRRPALILPEI